MEDMKQAPASPMGAADTGQQGMGQAQYFQMPGTMPGTMPGSMGGAQYAQPQAGGYYQYVPGAGFVQVGAQQMNPAMQSGMGMQANMNAQAMGTQPGMAADAAAQGMVGPGTPEGTEPKFDQNKIGQMYGVVNDVMNGEADPAKVMSLFEGLDGDFWKGAIVGAAVGFLASNDTVRGAVAGAFGSMFGEGDPEGPQVTVGASADK